MKENKSIITAIAPTLILIIALAYIMYVNPLNQPRQIKQPSTHDNTDRDTKVVLIVNKSIEEWKKIYRDYIIHSDMILKKYNAIVFYNLTELLSIIDKANTSTIVREFYIYDKIVGKHVVLKIVIPQFAIELHLHYMPTWRTEPIIEEIANKISEYVRKYPSNYTEYRLAFFALEIASQISYEHSRTYMHPLLTLAYNLGNCEAKSELAIEIATALGLWAANVIVKPCKSGVFDEWHEYVAVAIDNPPPWLRGRSNFTWEGHTFYLAEVASTWLNFPVKPYPCSYIEYIFEPYTEKGHYIGRSLW